MNLDAELARMFRSYDMRPTDPDEAERKADAILSIQNRNRYVRQSAATKDGMRAELPEYEPNPPTPDEVIEAGRFKYGA